MSRRQLIVSGAVAAGALVGSPRLLGEALAAPARAGASPYGPLGPPDGNGLMLPPGFRSREVARGLSTVAGYSFPVFPDGQATFPSAGGGWILVTNSESLAASGAGASAISFSADGRIGSAYRILGGTNLNCAGGPTPWGTWLSCEEWDGGLVWECDPAGKLPAVARPALGVFNHEAAAVDPVRRQVYLTEDKEDGGFYRFTPAAYPDLSEGLLEVAVVGPDNRVNWRAVPNPTPTPLTPTRGQVPEMTPFNGGEGLWHDGGVLYFTTKGDKRLWAYDARSATIEIVFDRATAPDSSLDAVDNVTVSSAGEIFVCEDGGNMEIGLITPEREVSPFLRFTGPSHPTSGQFKSEVCGVVFDPSGTRMYCTSQRSHPPDPSTGGPGAVYEISGPFRRSGGAGAPSPFGRPAGERRGGPLRRRGDELRVRAPRRIGRGRLLRRGLVIKVGAPAGARVTAVLDTADLLRRPSGDGTEDRPRTVSLARRRFLGLRRARRPRLRLGPRARRRLSARRRPFTARLLVTARLRDGRRLNAVRRIRVVS